MGKTFKDSKRKSSNSSSDGFGGKNQRLSSVKATDEMDVDDWIDEMMDEENDAINSYLENGDSL